MAMKNIRKWLLLALVISLILISGCRAGSSNKKLHITIDGKEYENIDIDKNGITIIETSLGYNKVLVENGNIRVLEADCPDKICVKKGFINKDMDNMDMIVCAPHKLCISFY